MCISLTAGTVFTFAGAAVIARSPGSAKTPALFWIAATFRWLVRL
jgi:hypothetical protein